LEHEEVWLEIKREYIISVGKHQGLDLSGIRGSRQDNKLQKNYKR